MRAAPLLLATALLGCAGAPTEARPGAPVVGRPFTVWFEPPLPGPGHLLVTCESGERWEGAVAPTSATVTLPDGPATLVLEAGGRRHERVLRVAPGERELVWRLDGR